MVAYTLDQPHKLNMVFRPLSGKVADEKLKSDILARRRADARPL